MLTYQYRLVPTKAQHRVLEQLVESQRLLYNAALEERIGAYRRGVTLTYFDQARGLTEWRQADVDAASLPLTLQRATLKRLDEAYKGFFRRVRAKTGKAGFPRFRSKWIHEIPANSVPAATPEFRKTSMSDGTIAHIAGYPWTATSMPHETFLDGPEWARACPT